MSISFNIKSQSVRVYPAVNRNVSVSGDMYARHTSEQFLSGIVNKLIDREGFVITLRDDFKLDNPFKFNVNGYYFTIDKLSTIIKSEQAETVPKGGFLYAYIDVKLDTKSGTDHVWNELLGCDTVLNTGNDGEPDEDEYVYSSLVITDNKPTSGIIDDGNYILERRYIPILGKAPDGSSDLDWCYGWYVPEDSYVKFDGRSFVLDGVDGGDLNNLIK